MKAETFSLTFKSHPPKQVDKRHGAYLSWIWTCKLHDSPGLARMMFMEGARYAYR